MKYALPYTARLIISILASPWKVEAKEQSALAIHWFLEGHFS
jgi:hypothetical protein